MNKKGILLSPEASTLNMAQIVTHEMGHVLGNIIQINDFQKVEKYVI